MAAITYVDAGQYKIPNADLLTVGFFEKVRLPELVVAVLKLKGFEPGKTPNEWRGQWLEMMDDDAFIQALYDFYGAVEEQSRNSLIADSELTRAFYEIFKLKQVEWVKTWLENHPQHNIRTMLPTLAVIAVSETTRNRFDGTTPEDTFSPGYASTYPHAYAKLIASPEAITLITRLKQERLIRVTREGDIDGPRFVHTGANADLFVELAGKPQAVEFLIELLGLPRFTRRPDRELMDEHRTLFDYGQLRSVIDLSERTIGIFGSRPAADQPRNQALVFLGLPEKVVHTSDILSGAHDGPSMAWFVKLCGNTKLRDYAYSLLSEGGRDGRTNFTMLCVTSQCGNQAYDPCLDGLAKIFGNNNAREFFPLVLRTLSSRNDIWAFEITGPRERNAQFIKLAQDPKRIELLEMIGSTVGATIWRLMEGERDFAVPAKVRPPEEILQTYKQERGPQPDAKLALGAGS